jgi:hypothetical protein
MKVVLILTLLSIIAKIAEESKHIRAEAGAFVSVAGLYQCFNFHLHLSLGMLGFVAATSSDVLNAIIVVGIVFAGAVSKGAMSNHEPERFHYRDWDMMWGLIVPNTLAICAIDFSLYIVSSPTKGANHQSESKETQSAAYLSQQPKEVKPQNEQP